MSSVIETKSFAFAVRIVKLFRHVYTRSPEIKPLWQQVLRSCTSIGANVAEAVDAQSLADFISKRAISLKEARETHYWLRLLHETEYLTDAEFDSLHEDCLALLRLLTASLRKLRERHQAARKQLPQDLRTGRVR